MTRSFTCMVLGLQALAAAISSRKDFMDALRKLPAFGRNVLNGLDDRIRNFVDKNECAYYVCLAQGPDRSVFTFLARFDQRAVFLG